MEIDGLSAYYNYDASGNRNLKFVGKVHNYVQNGINYLYPELIYQTLYASDLITINSKGYTKHYFEEGKRICSKIGGGFTYNNPVYIFDNHVHPLGEKYDEQEEFQIKGIEITFDECIRAFPVLSTYIPLIKIIDLNIGRHDPEPAFFYHTDHLGSSSYLTDDGGNITQTINYLPYGETWVDIQTFNMIDYNLGVYLFNGKEKDQETGYNYFGARYYDSENISWLSVDPLSDKYPSISPYNYCMWNPIKYIDPDGMEIEPDWFKKTKDSEPHFDILVKNQADATRIYGKDAIYLGPLGRSIDENTGKNILHLPDGSTIEGGFLLNGTSITQEQNSHEKTMSNPIVQAIHKGQRTFVLTLASIANSALGNVGAGISVAGYLSALFGADYIGIGIAQLGVGMQNASLMISAGLKFNKGNYSGGIIDITTYGVGRAIKSGLTKFGIEGMDHDILNNGFNVIKNNIGNKIANEVNDEIRKR